MSSFLHTFYLACPMCMSGAEGKSLLAANSAIGLMLVLLMGIFVSLFSFIIYLAKRAKKYASEVPGDE